tara:strand:- start:215 stop:949 length:735 start_codon:yes stop_codon:yes gene_type:complete
MSINFCITLTTIPSRIKTIEKTISSLNNQILKPNIIFLNIPYYYNRLNQKIDEKIVDQIRFDNVKIVRCDDFGPSTSFLGPLEKIKNKYECMIIVNDDHIYDKNMTKIFIENFEKKKTNYSFYVQKIFKINMAQAADGFLIDTSLLAEAKNFYNKHVKDNKNLRVDDDLWISIYLQEIMKSEIINLIDQFREKTQKKIVYVVHTNNDSLHMTVHKRKVFWNRRKIAKVEIIKFKIKNYLSSLIQ